MVEFLIHWNEETKEKSAYREEPGRENLECGQIRGCLTFSHNSGDLLFYSILDFPLELVVGVTTPHKIRKAFLIS